MEEQRNRKPAEPTHRGWRIGRQQLVGLWLLTIPIVAIGAAYVLLLLYPPRGISLTALCLSNVAKVAGAVLEYAGHHNGTLPQSRTWEKDIRPYLPADAEDGEFPLRCPVTGNAYVLNDKLAGKPVEEIASPADVPLVWEARTDNGRPPHEGRFNVGFLDGHTRWLNEATFSELMTRGQ